MQIAFIPPIPSATDSEQDVVMEEHRKVRGFCGGWGFNAFLVRIACEMVSGVITSA